MTGRGKKRIIERKKKVKKVVKMKEGRNKDRNKGKYGKMEERNNVKMREKLRREK